MSEPIKFKHVEFNNDTIWANMQWYDNYALRLVTLMFIEDSLCNLRAKMFFMTQLLINI